MKKILLVSNYVFHYRINNYNYFYDEFKKIGYEFIVLANDAQKVEFNIKFPLIIQKGEPVNYIKKIQEIKPDAVIIFLHLKDVVIYFVSHFCKLKGIPLIYWNFGINITNPDAPLRNALYYHFHNISDAIILYSPNELNIIKKKNHHKTFIANNTLNFTDRDYSGITNKKYLQEKYHVREDFVILFVGRITPNKQLDVLLSIFRNHKSIALVVVGKEITIEQKAVFDGTLNYYYLGEIYNKDEICRIFYSSDVFCIPGNMGLGLNEAFFWAKPVITLEGPNSPEIYYLKNGQNGYIVKDVQELEEKILYLLHHPEVYKEMSLNAKYTADNEAHISIMFKGFKNAVAFLLNKKK